MRHETSASATLLLLSDGRLPTGSHVHSGGVEEACADGRVAGVDDLRAYLVGRLWSLGVVDAAFAVAAWQQAGDRTAPACEWRNLDAEAAARVASPALRAACRSQGRGLLRAARRLWPANCLDELASAFPEGSMWAPALGAAARAAGLEAGDAALVAAQAAVTTPAWAAVRLLGLDPFRVAALLADLADSVDAVAESAVSAAGRGRDLSLLPALSGPLAEVAAEVHATREVRLFAS